MNLKDYIASIENYPQEGIISVISAHWWQMEMPTVMLVREIVQYATDKKIDMIVGPEAAWIYRWMSSCFWVGNWFCART